MKTKELVKWAGEAEAIHEKSWLPNASRYKLTYSEAVEKTRPKEATDVEVEIVIIWLYHAWNEVQDWCSELKITINW